jgi:hypothetical protein
MKTWIALSLLAATAQAGQRCYSNHHVSAPTNWSGTSVFPKHEGTIGALESVTVTLRGPLALDVRVENLGGMDKHFEFHSGISVNALRPDSTSILDASTGLDVAGTLASFDGTLDCDGASGQTYTNLHADCEASIVLRGAADLALFTASTPGETIALGVEANGSSLANGPGNLFTSFTSGAGVDLTVCYGYRETCHADFVPATLTNWQATRTFAKHDPAIGPLHAVRVRVQAALTGSFALENPNPVPVTVSSTFAVRTAVQRPDTTELLGFETAHAVVEDLDAFDGTIDFAGNSGVFHGGIATQSSTDAVLTSPADLALFTASAPGETITLGLTGVGASAATGPGPILTQFTTNSGVDVIEVCYDFGAHVVPSCAGDGSVVACPCGNDSPTGALQGCLNSFGLGGELRGAGTASLGDDTLVLAASNLPPSTFAVLLQGTTSPATPFGDGILCAGGIAQRLGTRGTSGGMASFPQPGTTISQLGGAVAGLTLHYQAWYRNVVPFCAPAGFNLTNGITITW